MSNDIIPSTPSGHFRLSQGLPRQKGDLFWSTTLRAWCATTIGEGVIPAHGFWCRKAQTTLALPPPAKPVSTAPRATNAKATPSRDWTRNSTPLMYVISDPFSGDDQLLVYQLDELPAALNYLQHLIDHDWAILYVFYQDHATQEYDRHMLVWREKNEVKDPLGLLAPGARS